MQQKSSLKKLNVVILICISCVALLVIGCAEPEPVVQKPPKQSIIGRKTQDIGEYDPNSGDVEADQQVEVSANPLAAAGAYGYAVGAISKMAIEKALQLYEAENERYPKDHAEFMEEIIKKNNIQLPVLPGGDQYQYDVENHELKIIEGSN